MQKLFYSIKNSSIVKGLVYGFVGIFTYPGLNIINRMKIYGMENLKNLPRNNVLFVSNHQTYFADVISFIHIFCASKKQKKTGLDCHITYYGLLPV